MKLFGRLFGRKQQRAERYKQRAWEYLRAEDYRRGREEFSLWVEREPQSATAWLGYGWCSSMFMGSEGADADNVSATCEPMFEKAIRLNEESRELTPDQLAVAHLLLGLLQKVRGQSETAARHFKAAIEAAPESPVSREARGQLGVRTADESNLETTERLLENAGNLLKEARRIYPALFRSKKLKIHRRELESFHILFQIRSRFLDNFEETVVVKVHPDDTLGEIAARVLPKYGLPSTGGMFFYKDDKGLPFFPDSDPRGEPYQTVRELGIQKRDTIHYLQTAEAPGAGEASKLIRSVQRDRSEGRPALARREIRRALESVKQHHAEGRLEEAESLVDVILQLDPKNAEAQDLSRPMHAAIRERDAGSASADGANWLHSHGGPTRTSQTARGPVPPLQPVWEFGSENVLLSPPVAARGQVYVASWDQRLYCLDGKTGQERWQWTAKTILDQPPVVMGKNVYIVDREGLYCLSARTGKLRWQYTTAQLCSPVLDNGKVYLADRAGILRCLNAETGQEISQLSTDEVNLHSLAGNGSRIIAVSNRAVLCVDSNLSRVLWRREGRFDDAMPVFAYNNVYIGTFAEGLWCLEADSGRLNWIFATEAWIRAAPAVGRGRIFFGDTEGRFACLEALTGELLWIPKEWAKDCWTCSAAPVVAGPYVYVLLDDGVLYCLDSLSGAEVWRGAAEQWQSGIGSLAVTAQSVYYASRNGMLSCMGSADLVTRFGKKTVVETRPPKRTAGLPLAAYDDTIQIRAFNRPSSLSSQEMADLHLASRYLLEKRYEKAIVILRRLERDHPDEDIVLHNLATAYESRGLVGDALATFDHILELNPGNADAFAAIGRLLRAHPDIIEEIYGQPEPIHQPPTLGSRHHVQPGLTTAMTAQEAVLLCQADPAYTGNLTHSSVWYWWQLIETSHYPVVRFHLEFNYHSYRLYSLRLPLNVADLQTKAWLERLKGQDTITVHIYDQTQKYCFSRRMNFAAEQRDRLRSLYERAQSALAALPVTSRDFQLAVTEAQAIWDNTGSTVDEDLRKRVRQTMRSLMAEKIGDSAGRAASENDDSEKQA